MIYSTFDLVRSSYNCDEARSVFRGMFYIRLDANVDNDDANIIGLQKGLCNLGNRNRLGRKLGVT